MIGKSISHYKVLAKLGEGGIGEVYKAEDLRFNRTVVLKFFPSEVTVDEEAKERFVHKAQAASSLQHSKICNFNNIDDPVLETIQALDP